MALALVHVPSGAQSSAATDGSSEAAGATDRSPQAQGTGVARPSAADIGIASMMQMLRDEGIDIDARMARARLTCRNQVTSEKPNAGADEVDQAVEECAVVEEGIIYAQAINEMNANRVSNFNDAMAQYNAQIAEADRRQREYERDLQGHSAEVAEIERQQEQYERDMAAHRELLAGRPGGARTVGGAGEQVPAGPVTPLPPVQTAAAEPAPPSTPPDSAPSNTRPAKVAPGSGTASLAANTPSTTSSPGERTRSADNSATGARGSVPAPTQGRRLSQSVGPSAQDDIALAVMEASGPRIALVIGNEDYAGSMGALSNPVNDAVLIGATLRSLGFDVEILTDASQREMKDAVRRLGDRLLAAGDNATGLFYYAGHGVQSQGANFLIPVGSVIDAESDLELEAVKADAILAQMEEAYISTRIVILDACRNMPLRRRARDGARGLARMETPNGSFVAYSTSPGSTAADGGGIHSPFAEALSIQMLVPNRPIEVTFREVRRQVVEMTNGVQVPWDSSSLLETFSFARGN